MTGVSRPGGRASRAAEKSSVNSSVASPLRRLLAGWMLGVVTEQAGHDRNGVVRGTIELKTAGRSPNGALIGADGQRWVFSGWAELGAALEDWRAPRPLPTAYSGHVANS
jgi:hypothetical protein